MRKKDVVLMATVTSFEDLPHPTKSELRQFAELFSPLFSASSEEARRQAVAALSQSSNVPAAVAFFIGCQPIAVAAPFLAASTCLSDEALITIARCQGADHAKAIVRREALSPTVIDALVGLRHDRTRRNGTPVVQTGTMDGTSVPLPAPKTPAATTDSDRLAREEELRTRIKMLAGHVNRAADDRLGLRSLSPIQEALLVRFARNRETELFATVLADVLTASRWLAERIMLDLSGQQLATVLKSLGIDMADACYILTRLYGHLAEARNGVSRAEALWSALDEDECGRRVEAWGKADRYTHGGPADAAIAEPEAMDRPMRTSASVRRTIGGFRGR